MSEWMYTTIGEVVNNFDYQRIPVAESLRIKGEYPYYGASGIIDYVQDYIFDGEYLLIAEDGENLKSRKTPIAFIAKGKFWVNNHAHIVKANDKAVTRYLLYAISNLDINGYLSGSAQPKLSQDSLNKIEVPLPPLSEQKKIARVLGNLDDKIEVNSRMNKTLEAMAMTLYRHYFVDFGLAPNEKYETDECPFGKLVDTEEMGPVPEGWKVGTIFDIANIMSGGTPKTQVDGYWSGEIPFFTPKDVGNSLYVFSTEKYITQEGLENCNSKLYPINTIFLTARGTVGKICLAGRPMAMNQSCYALKFKDADMPYFLYLSIKNAIQRILQISHGSVFNTITTDTFKMLHTVLAEQKILSQFHDKVEKLFTQLFVNENEIQILTQTRDYLLPKLLSGEVRVQ